MLSFMHVIAVIRKREKEPDKKEKGTETEKERQVQSKRRVEGCERCFDVVVSNHRMLGRANVLCFYRGLSVNEQ